MLTIEKLEKHCEIKCKNRMSTKYCEILSYIKIIKRFQAVFYIAIWIAIGYSLAHYIK